ncbi:DUF4259 domain-containing protein [Spongisporangium articulatum]|uniref:DUF4259 domain-containing protein n=1 Tax=Spongisporangium articulatum TaxID=3362603 RepID=A0ABW8ARM9_9ACTN
MGAWGMGVLDDDGAWDYLGDLIARPQAERTTTRDAPTRRSSRVGSESPAVGSWS